MELNKKKVLMTAIHNRDYYKLKEGIKLIDKSSFFIVTDSYQVYGQDSHRKKREEIED